MLSGLKYEIQQCTQHTNTHNDVATDTNNVDATHAEGHRVDTAGDGYDGHHNGQTVTLVAWFGGYFRMSAGQLAGHSTECITHADHASIAFLHFVTL